MIRVKKFVVKVRQFKFKVAAPDVVGLGMGFHFEVNVTLSTTILN